MTQCGYDSNKMNIRVASSGLTLGTVRPLSNPNVVFSKHRPQYPGPSGGNFCSKDKEKDVSAASFGTLKSQQKMGKRNQTKSSEQGFSASEIQTSAPLEFHGMCVPSWYEEPEAPHQRPRLAFDSHAICHCQHTAPVAFHTPTKSWTTYY